MKYIQYVNECIRTEVDSAGTVVLFGQNVSAGSCIGGLTRGLKNNPKCYVLNTPNIENTLVGVGFGLMLNGVSSVFFMKQQDFLLLGIDHMVNTYNFIRMNDHLASFTIVAVIVDSGYEGIQSSLNNFSDFCSIARVPGFTVTNKHDAEHIFRSHLVSPGFRIIGVSQRLFQTEILKCEENVVAHQNGEIFQYFSGDDATIACFNFSFPQGLKLQKDLSSNGINASLFSVNAEIPVDWSSIVQDVGITRKLIILDDSKSVNKPLYNLVADIYKKCRVEKLLIHKREDLDSYLRPCSDEFIVDSTSVLKNIY